MLYEEAPSRGAKPGWETHQHQPEPVPTAQRPGRACGALRPRALPRVPWGSVLSCPGDARGWEAVPGKKPSASAGPASSVGAGGRGLPLLT